MPEGGGDETIVKLRRGIWKSKQRQQIRETFSSTASKRGRRALL
jgi:hypothetical protein